MTTTEYLGEKARERDRFELELSDAFDVKASIALLILTFLGTISATILTADRISEIPKLAQIPMIASVVISGLFCVACLWPKYYLLDDLPETYERWLSTIEEGEQLHRLTRLNLELANGRIAHNHALNETKSWALNGAFWSMTIAIFVELCAIAYIAFSIRPS